MLRDYPDRAAREGVDGAVVLDCEVGRLGAMTSCEIVSETPAGRGFGQAALLLSRFYNVRLRHTGPDPMQEGRRLRLPIRFARP